MIDPALTFEPHRRHLLGLAYRMLGSIAEAEDAVQDAYLRWHAADRNVVIDPKGFLTTTTTRICLDILRSARVRREQYVGPWLPEPVIDTTALAPDAQTELAQDLSIALLLALDRLSPLERAAFLLHDVFDCSFTDVAAALDRSEAACRQLATRARTHVRDAGRGDPSMIRNRGGDATTTMTHDALVAAFVKAARSGDVEGLSSLLAEDARLIADGGGKVQAALNVINGADRIARFIVGVTPKGLPEGTTLRFGTVNGLPGLIAVTPAGSVETVAFEIEDGRIRAIYSVRNPDKLRHLSRA